MQMILWMRKKEALRPEDRALRQAWLEVDALQAELDDTLYTVDNMWERKETRDKLFGQFDAACEVCVCSA